MACEHTHFLSPHRRISNLHLFVTLLDQLEHCPLRGPFAKEVLHVFVVANGKHPFFGEFLPFREIFGRA
jgi:hypothetical protein